MEKIIEMLENMKDIKQTQHLHDVIQSQIMSQTLDDRIAGQALIDAYGDRQGYQPAPTMEDPYGNRNQHLIDTVNSGPQQRIIDYSLVFNSLFMNDEELKKETLIFAEDNNIPWKKVVMYIINEFLVEKASTNNEAIDEINKKLFFRERMKRTNGSN